MDDKGIIDLYFDRSEKAISETAVKYGNTALASHSTFLQTKRIPRKVSMTPGLPRGTTFRPECLPFFLPFSEKSPGTYP